MRIQVLRSDYYAMLSTLGHVDRWIEKHYGVTTGNPFGTSRSLGVNRSCICLAHVGSLALPYRSAVVIGVTSLIRRSCRLPALLLWCHVTVFSQDVFSAFPTIVEMRNFSAPKFSLRCVGWCDVDQPYHYF